MEFSQPAIVNTEVKNVATGYYHLNYAPNAVPPAMRADARSVILA
jgi:hypothetical protein